LRIIFGSSTFRGIKIACIPYVREKKLRHKESDMVVANIQLNSSLTGSIYSHEAFSGSVAASADLRTAQNEIALPAHLNGPEAIIEHLRTYADQLAKRLSVEFGESCTVTNHGGDDVLAGGWSKTVRIRQNAGVAVSVTLQRFEHANPSSFTILVSQTNDLEALRMPVLVVAAAAAGVALGAAASVALAGLIAGAAAGGIANVLLASPLRRLAGRKFAAANAALFARVQQVTRPQATISPAHYNHAA
jgi:hypothetical protein